MFCKECGARTDESGLCPNCEKAKSSGLSQNIAGLLCYILGWITGIIFLIADKRPFVRFHAVQSIVVFGALSVLSVLVSGILFLLPYSLWIFLRHISTLISIASLMLAIFLIVQAYQGKEYKLPIAGDIARKHANKN